MTFEFDEKINALFSNIEDISSATSKAEIIRSALRLYHMLMIHTTKGWTIKLTSNGQEKTVITV